MADFLASFNFRDSLPSQAEERSCASLEEVQSRLRDIFSVKVTPTRAEHVATTLELAGSAQLMLERERENEGIDGPGSIDPLLGGLAALSAANEQADGGGFRAVMASDALTNQPADNPVLQRSVAKAIINGLGALDGSEWTVKGLSRGTEGWKFVYVCKGSVNHWNRQNKSHVKTLVADCTQGDPDPQLSGRPAFDCRGSVTISFSRGSRTISIKYDHTPLHKTVAELAELFAPPPPPPPPPSPPSPVAEKRKTPKRPPSEKKQRKADKSPKEPKEPKEPKAPKTPKTPKAPKQPKQPKEKGASKKKKRKTGDDGQGQSDGAGVHSATGLSQSTTQDSMLAANGASAMNTTSQAQAGPGGTISLVNVSPEEAARRRNVAAMMLRDAGVDPDSLSPEQFNIFANQSPDLQKESLNMLVKYGAERLRIVHPGNREGSAASGHHTSNAQNEASSVKVTPSGPVTTGELALQTRGNGRGGTGEDEDEAETVPESPAPRRRRGKKSRAACIPCKQRKIKCPHELPECLECLTAGLICEYPPLKPKKPKSAATVAPEDLEADIVDETMMDVQEPEQEQEESPAPQVDEEYSEGPDSPAQPQMPVADMLTTDMGTADWGNSETENHYYQSTASMSVPTNTNPQSETIHKSASGLVLPQGRMYYPPHVPAADLQEHHGAETTSSGPTAIIEQRRQPLPDGVSGHAQRNIHQSPLIPHAATTSDWQTMSNLVTQAATASVLTPAMPNQTSGDGYGMANDSTRERQGGWRAAALSQAALSQNPMDNSQQASVSGAQQQQQQQQQQMSMASFNRHNAAASPILDSSQLKSARSSTHSSQGTFNNNRMSETMQTPASSHGSVHDSSTTYNHYDRYSDTRSTTNVSSNGRITYEPYSYQRSTQSTSTYPSYSQNTHHSHATTAAAMPSTTVTAVAPPLDHSSSRLYSQFPQPQSRTQSQSHAQNHNQSQGQGQGQARSQTQSQHQNQGQSQSQSHGHSTSHGASHGTPSHGYGTRLSREQDTSTSHAYDSRTNFDLRATSSSRPSQSSAKPDRSGYSSYSSQMQQQPQSQQQQQQQQAQQSQSGSHGQRHGQQTSQQHQGWYNFNNTGASTFGSSSGHGGGTFGWGS